MTGYALSVTFGSPFLAIATAKMDRRHALLLLMGVFIAGNVLCAVSPNYWLLMGARVVTALSVSYTHLRGHATVLDLVCRSLLQK